jgi:hypothetical protein
MFPEQQIDDVIHNDNKEHDSDIFVLNTEVS